MRPAASIDDLPPPPPETVQQKLKFWTYRTLWEAAGRLPERAAWRLAGRVGDVWYRSASSSRRTQVRRNIGRVHGHPPTAELDRATRDAFRWYARYWLDSFHIERVDPSKLARLTTNAGTESLAELHADGGGIMVTGHLGSWDVAAAWCHLQGWRLAAVAEVVEPRRLFDRFVATRRAIGLEILPLVRGGDMVQRLEGTIASGGIATLLADRDLTKKGPVVDFFGEPCRLPPGAAALARRTGRPIVAAAGFATPDGWFVASLPAVDISHLTIEEGTQVVAHELEKLIALAPDQWHVFVPNWLRDREPDHPALAAFPDEGDR